MKNNTKKRITTNLLSTFLAFSLCLSFFCFEIFATDTFYLQTEEIDDATIISKLSAIPSSDFGGCYYDENGNLKLNLKQGSTVVLSAYLSTAERMSVGVSYVEYSLSELSSVNALIAQYVKDLKIASIGTDVSENKVNIRLYEDNEYFRAFISSNIPSTFTNMLNISVIDESIKICSTIASEPPSQYPREFASIYDQANISSGTKSANILYPGLVIAFRNNPSSTEASFCTAGPRYSSTKFYTAGHCITSFSPEVYDYNNRLQIGTASSKVFGANGDRCTVTVSASLWSLPSSNQFIGGMGSYSLSYSFSDGIAVELWGGYSGISTGTIIEQDVTITTSDGDIVGNLVRASYTCRQGDSGGGIFTINASTSSSAKCYGTQSIGVFQNGSSVSIESYFSPLR